ncbi:MAG: tail fiber domain-containing protein [Ignavibacteriaceae bacterium]|nr:tail fiber domain-containing protein [Ignavibacteriaceae bacterium]
MKTLLRLIAVMFLITVNCFSQDITATIATDGNFVIKDATSNFFYLKQSNGLLGLGGVTNPRAQLEVGGTEGILSTGTVGSGTSLNLGAGSRLHWYPKKAAFRVGAASGTHWNDSNIGLYSIAMGNSTRAMGVGAIAIGDGSQTGTVASGDYSIAIGRGANTNFHSGSMVIGDNAQFQIAYSSQPNELTTRFIGGYRFYTSTPDSNSGVYMRGNMSGWSNYCDRNLKENFETVDGELLLSKIKELPITKWNYKSGDPSIKYIGPVAQDFYKAFQLGGTDSLGINSICIEGVSLAGVKALEERTSEIIVEINLIKNKNVQLELENKYLKEQLSNIGKLDDELSKVSALRTELEKQLKTLNNRFAIVNETIFK